ncbi:MAG: GlxA family transcriptional regulator [Acidiferrobacterales bacterium]|nr:GlxA family transcriptional regulator [Acidiferrobacterales bacterium]
MSAVQDIEIGYVKENAQNTVGIYLTDTFNLLPMVAALEPLRIANRVSKKVLFHWSIVTNDGLTVSASNGLSHAADYSTETAPVFDFLIVTGPFYTRDIQSEVLIKWVKYQHQHLATLIGLESGCHTLAKAGLLEGRRCTTHWEHREEYRNNWPEHQLSNDIYEMDENIFTCSGGAAPMDMMLFLLERMYDHELAASVADRMIHPHIRNSGEPQTMDLRSRTGVNHPVVLECIQLIEANIEQPLLPEEIAELIGISKRQLERLFLRYMKTSPARYYLTQRLEAARSMLEQSNTRIVDIAKATGFRSAGHFSTRYLSSYGITPSEARSRSIDVDRR